MKLFPRELDVEPCIAVDSYVPPATAAWKSRIRFEAGRIAVTVLSRPNPKIGTPDSSETVEPPVVGGYPVVSILATPLAINRDSFDGNLYSPDDLEYDPRQHSVRVEDDTHRYQLLCSGRRGRWRRRRC